MLDLKELERKLDEQLSKETWWSLTLWLWKDRIRTWLWPCRKWFRK